MIIIKKIIALIEKSNKTRYQIAKETGISAATLSRIVNGHQNRMELKTAFKLADALEVSLDEFREEGLNE